MVDFVELFACGEAEGGIAGGDEAFVGVGIQIGHELLEHGGGHAVVVGGPGEVFAFGFAETPVQRSGQFEVDLVVDDADTAVFFSVLLHDIQ